MEYKNEVKLDKSTLPKDKQWIVFDLHDKTKIVGEYNEKEETILSKDYEHPVSIYHVLSWESLKITWEFTCWAEKSVGEAFLKGCDDYNNDFEATASYAMDEVVEEPYDIEWVGSSNNVG